MHRRLHMSYTSTVETHEHIPIAKSTMAVESVGEYLLERLVDFLHIHKVILIDVILRIFRPPTGRKVRNDVTSPANIVRINEVI